MMMNPSREMEDSDANSGMKPHLLKRIGLGVATAVILLMVLGTNGGTSNDKNAWDQNRPTEMKIESRPPGLLTTKTTKNGVGRAVVIKLDANSVSPGNCVTPPPSGPPSDLACVRSKDAKLPTSPLIDSKSYGVMLVKKSGWVRGVKIEHVSGWMSNGVAPNGYWGSTHSSWRNNMYVWVTDAQNHVMFPTRFTTPLNSLSQTTNGFWASSSAGGTMEKTITLEGEKVFHVNAGDEIRLWHGEMLAQSGPLLGDNADVVVCANVTLIYGNPPPSDLACIRSKDYKSPTGEYIGYGSVYAKKSGWVRGVKIEHVSGWMSVRHDYAHAYWGTTYLTPTWMYVWVTNAQNHVLFPTRFTTPLDSLDGAYGGWWRSSSATGSMENTFTLEGEKVFHVNAGDEIRLWHGEQLTGCDCGTDNADVVMCANVTLIYDPSLNNKPVLCSDFSNANDCDGCGCMWDGAIATCRCRPASQDFVFLVDGSESISASGFEVQREIVSDMVKHMVPMDSGIGIIQFSDVLKTEVPLLPRATATAVLDGVSKMTQIRGGTRIGEAMQEALGANFLGASGARNASWIVLMTDGVSSGEVKPCDLVSKIRANPDLHVLVIGVSSGFQAGSVKCLVENEPNPADHIIKMPSYSFAEFQAVAPNVTRKICSFEL